MGQIEKSLLIKFFNKECTTEEKEEVILWLKEPGNKDEVENLLALKWDSIDKDEAGFDSNLSKIHEKILNEISGEQKNNYTYKKRPAPNIKRAMVLTSIMAIFIGFITVYKFYLPATLERKEVVQHIVKAPSKGEKLTTQLPDGTIVTLNSESTIEFPKKFDENERKIKLTGEAFFDVHKDPSRPFTVVIGNMEVTALGTSFNINSYDEHEDIVVTLVTGKVSVTHSEESAILNEGEAAIFNKQVKTLETNKVDPNLSTLWKKGILYFNKTSFNEVVNMLERWYNVKIQVTNEPKPSLVFYGKFDNANLDNVLKSIGFALGFEYEIKNKEVLINFKK